MTTINIPDNWLPTSENINALPEPLRKYIHDLHTASDYATLVRQEALTRAEYNILRKMIEEAPEVTFQRDYWDRALGIDNDAEQLHGKRVKLVEAPDVGG